MLIPDEDAAIQVFLLPSIDPLAKLSETFAAYAKKHNLPSGDALELLLWPDLTEAQHRWLSAFIILWDLTQKEADA